MKAIEFYNWQPMPPPPVSKRLTCPNCGEKLTVELNTESNWTKNEKGQLKLKKAPATGWRYTYPQAGHFCTLRCATDFANKTIDNKKL